MKTINSLYGKVFTYTVVIFLIIIGASHSIGCEWSETFGGSGWDEGYPVQQTTDGGYVIAGRSFLVQSDAGGNELWSKTFGGIENDAGSSVQLTTDK